MRELVRGKRRPWPTNRALRQTSGPKSERALDNLRQVSAIVDAKAPDDAADFKTWLRSISQAVAAAAKEGGFLGVGGVHVSDAERAILADIAKALGTS